MYTDNLLIDSLPQAQRETLVANSERVELKQHQIVFDVREAIDDAYFPFDAVVSLVVPLSTGAIIETAMVGRDGVVGASAALGSRISINRGVVQLGGHALQCKIEDLKVIVEQDPVIRKQFNAHEHVLFAEAQQSAACNVTHTLENRLARWLLRARDLSGKDDLELTQEYLAEMLGVGRTTVSLVAHTLQSAGLISYRRGHIHLTDTEGLQEVSCECYQAVKLNYDAMMASLKNT